MRGRKDDGTWTNKDRIMALALTAYEAGVCSGCGLHSSVAHGDENVGRHEAAEFICHGCEAAESFQEANKDSYPGRKIGLVQSPGWD